MYSRAMCLTTALGSILLACGAHAASVQHCPPLGPVLPAATRPSADESLTPAATELTSKLKEWTSTFNSSAVSIGVRSIHESTPMFEFHHSPPNFDPRGVSEIDSINLEDPVTKYLPELRDLNEQAEAQDEINTVDWDEITLGALASHQSGIGADLTVDLVNMPGDWTAKGFPPADNSTLIGCSELFGKRPCKKADFLAHFGKHPPVFAPFTTASYSNIGTILLGLVIEKVTNQTYEQWIRNSILNPVGMNHSFTSTPSDSLGFISSSDVDWAIDLGVEGPTGGLYSSVNDLLTFGKSILSYEMLSPAKTRKWMKPLSATSSVSTFVGAPWEIYRSNNVTKDGRLIEFYTKAGDLFTYHSSIALIPDYDLVIVALVAGDEVDSSTSYRAIGDAATALLPVLEEAGKAEADIQYAGVYSDVSSNSSLTLSLDDGPGLVITRWQVRGVNVIATPLLGDHLLPNPPPVRLYPMSLFTTQRTSWRAVFQEHSADEAAEEDALFPWNEFSCGSWGVLDRYAYQYKGRDSFVFEMAQEGAGLKAKSLNLPGYQVTLEHEA